MSVKPTYEELEQRIQVLESTIREPESHGQTEKTQVFSFIIQMSNNQRDRFAVDLCCGPAKKRYRRKKMDEDQQETSSVHEWIVYADDEKPIADVGKRMLEHEGYKVPARTDSVAAFEELKAAPDKFDLVITDYIMPRMSGSELAREMIKVRPDIPIILCTGYSALINAREAKSIGFREYCQKPLIREDLSAIVRKVLDE